MGVMYVLSCMTISNAMHFRKAAKMMMLSMKKDSIGQSDLNGVR